MLDVMGTWCKWQAKGDEEFEELLICVNAKANCFGDECPVEFWELEEDGFKDEDCCPFYQSGYTYPSYAEEELNQHLEYIGDSP